MREKKWLVPDTIDPAEKVCVQLEIPNDLLHIAAFWGALEQLSKAYNWEDSYVDGSQTAYVWRDVIQDASELVRTGVNCMLDCDDVEDCLDTSPTIITIEGDIVNNETNIVNNTTEITNIYENPPDGNVYPEAPDMGTEPDAACGAAFYVVAQARVWIADLEDAPVTYPDLLDALAAYLISSLLFVVTVLVPVLETVFGGTPSVLTDFDAQLDEMREELYCNGIDKTAFSDFVRTTLTNGAAIADYIDCIAQSSWANWYSVGMADDSQDCSSFVCGTWCYRFEFTTGLHGWTIAHGTQTGQGLETGHRDAGGGTYHDVEAYLDLTGINATQMRVVGMFVNADLDNSSIVFWGRPLGSGTGQIYEQHGLGWSATNSPRDESVDISDWTDIAMHMRCRARVAGMYTEPNPEAYIEYIELSGDGANPFGEDNCS